MFFAAKRADVGIRRTPLVSTRQTSPDCGVFYGQPIVVFCLYIKNNKDWKSLKN